MLKTIALKSQSHTIANHTPSAPKPKSFANKYPNYSDKYDPTNHPVIGGGPVVKINANCKYMTDADGSAVFRELCREAGVDCQYFVNHSDVAGGSTLGNILTGQLDLRGVDMGCAIWAMHSAVETGGVDDHEATARVFARFYSC